ncbi:MAG TPA: M12 family metallo-peptidase [Steroidobacteraceae bacterium]|nr:M12 family metallo-peptidase [Steroidobacteraceae bacterium]
MASRIALWVLALGFAANAAAQSPAIQYAEPVALALKSGTAQFDAYGRRFSLTLVDNDRVLNKLSAQRKQQLQSYKLLRGSLDGAPGSWVRLTETPAGVEGAIWDGRDFYTVTRYDRIADFLTTPLDAVGGQTVVYRLSDSIDVLPREFCALAGDTPLSKAANGLEQYQSLVREIEAGVLGPQLTRQIEISLIGDTDFQAAESADPTAAMLARLNIVEGIFSEQVGLLILATDVRLMAPGADPFTATKGATLLEQLGAYRKSTAEVRARGLAHLMTGKDLDGTTAGIAYVRTVCDVERGVSVSSRSFGTTISALVMAHELGHNFGAEHDGEAGTICEGTPGGFIMASSVSGYSTFSQCSLETMEPVIASADCVAPASYADVTVDAGVTSVSGEGGVPFGLPFVVRSTGNTTAMDAVLTITLPNNAAYTIDSAASSLGSCQVSGLVVNCQIGAMPAEASAQVNVVARSTAAANFVVQARVTAANDRITSNNNRQLAVTLRSGVDAAVVLSTSAGEVALGAPIEAYADVSSLRAMPLRNATLSLNLNQPVTQANMPGATCTTNASSVSCTIADLPAGSTRRLSVQATTQVAGPLFASASVSAVGDGDLSNNNASTTAWVQAERDVEITAGSAIVDLGVATVYTVPYSVRSRGPLPTGDVVLTISMPSSSVAVDSIDAGGTTCTRPDALTIRCELGALAPGATRAVSLRVHGAAPVSGSIGAAVEAAGDAYLANNSAGVQLRIDHVVDLGVVMASGGSGVEDAPLTGQVSLRSNGRQSATGATLDIALHSAGTLRAVSIHNGEACTLVDAQRARCALPAMARNAQLYVDYSAEFAEPGSYDVSFVTTTPGDTAADNDTLTRAVLVRPFYDVAVAGDLNMGELFGGEARVKTFTVTTDRRAIATARFVAAHAAPAVSVESISAASGGAAFGHCRIEADGGVCDFSDLAAFASVDVTVTYRAAQGTFAAKAAVSVTTSGDVISTNNAQSAAVQTHGMTDLELRADSKMSGPMSSALSFPLISVINGAEVAYGARLEVTLPAQVTLVSVSASNATCSGTSVLRCDFTKLDPLATATVSLNVRGTATGNFVSALKLTASNDNNPANDNRDVAVEIAGGDPAAASSGGSAKGGGRMEWLALVLLLSLVLRRCFQMRAARQIPGGPTR